MDDSCKVWICFGLFVLYILFGLPIAFAEPSLNVFIKNVISNSPAIQAAEFNLSATKARERASAQSLYNPELTVQKENALENQTSIGISQTVDWANKRGAHRQVGAANTLVAQTQLAEIRQKIAVQILVALARYQAEEKAVSLAKDRTKLLHQFVELTTKRYKSGDIARVDLDLAQLALSEAIAQQADAQVSLNEALQTLRATTGFNRKSWPRLSSALPKLAQNSINVDDLVDNLPTILVLNQQYQAARKRIQLAQRERYSDPTIGVQGGESSGGGERKKLVGLTLSMPLYILNSYRAQVDAANYDAMEAERKRDDIIRQARAEIISSAERYQTILHATQQWQQIAGKPLSDGMVLIERLWQSGEISSTDYIVQLKQRIDSQIAGVNLNGHAWRAWAEWLKASGQVENWLQL